MRRAVIEQLEFRCLLSGNITAVGNPDTISTVPGQYAPTASCAIGSGNNVMLAYVKNNVLEGVILDGTSGGVVVPEFAISTVGQTVGPYRPIAAVQDSNGNAVVAYGVGNVGATADTLFIARFNAAGGVVNAPTPVTQANTGDQAYPALAIGSNDSVGIAYVDETSIGQPTTTVFCQVNDASDVPLFPAMQISPASTSASQNLTTPALVFLPSGKFLAAWNAIDFDSSNIATSVYIGDNTFSPTGVLGTAFSGLQQNVTTADNNLSRPILLPNTDGTTTVYLDQVLYTSSLTYSGTNILTTTVGEDGSWEVNQPTTLYTVGASGEVLVTEAVPKLNGSSPFTDLIFQSGVNGSTGLVPSSVWSIGLDSSGNAVSPVGQIFAAAAENVSYSNSVISYTVIDAVGNTTTIYAQPVIADTTIAPAWSIADGTTRLSVPHAVGNSYNSITFTVTLSQPAPVGGASVNVDIPASEFGIARTIPAVLAEGETSVMVTYTLYKSLPNGGTFQVTLTGNGSDTTIQMGTATATILPYVNYAKQVKADGVTIADDVFALGKAGAPYYKLIFSNLKAAGELKAGAKLLKTLSAEDRKEHAAVETTVSKTKSLITYELNNLIADHNRLNKHPTSASLQAAESAAANKLSTDAASHLTLIDNAATAEQQTDSTNAMAIADDFPSGLIDVPVSSMIAGLIPVASRLEDSAADLLTRDVPAAVAGLTGN